jgi:hypothetical protein
VPPSYWLQELFGFRFGEMFVLQLLRSNEFHPISILTSNQFLSLLNLTSASLRQFILISTPIEPMFCGITNPSVSKLRAPLSISRNIYQYSTKIYTKSNIGPARNSKHRLSIPSIICSSAMNIKQPKGRASAKVTARGQNRQAQTEFGSEWPHLGQCSRTVLWGYRFWFYKLSRLGSVV